MGYRKKLKSQKIMEISMGEYRVFISISRYGEDLCVGLPLSNCRNKDAWIDEDGYSHYLPVPKAKNLLRNALGQTRFVELANNPEVAGLL
jgi:flagellar basal body rod protein FlgF